MLRIIPTACLIALLLGCTSVPSEEPIAVQPDKLDNYWVISPTIPLDTVISHEAVTTACAIVEFTIDRFGEPQNLKVVGTSDPGGSFEMGTLAHVRRLRFVPAPNNSGRAPIRTKTGITFEVGGLAGNDAILAKCAL